MTLTSSRPPFYLTGAYPIVGQKLLTKAKFPTHKSAPKRKLSLEPNIHGFKASNIKPIPTNRVSRGYNSIATLPYTSALKRQLMRSASTNINFKPILTERNLSSNKRINKLQESSMTNQLGSTNHSAINPVATMDIAPSQRQLKDESFDESLACLIRTLEDCV